MTTQTADKYETKNSKDQSADTGFIKYNFKCEDLKNICYQSRLGQEGRQEQITEETSYVLLKLRAERMLFCWKRLVSNT